MLRNSYVEARASVSFPEFRGERHYMIPFFQQKGLSAELKHWQPTVDAMLEGVRTELPIYLMVDQKFVAAGTAHRRPGIHVDGYWDDGHGSGTGHRPINLSDVMLAHGPEPRPGHNSVISCHVPNPPGHKSIQMSGHTPTHWSNNNGWADAALDAPEAIILATDITSAIAYRGKWSGTIGDMGDCNHIDVSRMEHVIMQANTVFAGNAAMLHESTPVFHDCFRTVVRLNVPGYSPELH